MKVIGIAGGVASGKSVVSSRLQELGAFVIDADRIGHSVLDEPAVIDRARERWGDQIVDEDGRLIRSEIAERVFPQTDEAKQELRFWESVTHPRINDRISQTIKELRRSGKFLAAILDAPVMFKAGWHEQCDMILFVDASTEVRMARAIQRGWSRKQFEDRESSQTPIEEKKMLAGFVIDNSGELKQTYEQVLRFWNVLSH